MIKHKFRAKPQEYDGIKFASKKETQRYIHLQNLQKSGEVLFFLRQVPFYLPGGVKYLLDFLVFWADGSVTMEDSKGVRTPLYIAKKKMVEAIYPVEIIEV
jgi:hypothetical protein